MRDPNAAFDVLISPIVCILLYNPLFFSDHTQPRRISKQSPRKSYLSPHCQWEQAALSSLRQENTQVFHVAFDHRCCSTSRWALYETRTWTMDCDFPKRSHCQDLSSLKRARCQDEEKQFKFYESTKTKVRPTCPWGGRAKSNNNNNQPKLESSINQTTTISENSEWRK